MEDSLKVCEWFESIQGEGIYAGTPALFIRLSGCNLRCTHCDTRYAWEEGDKLTVKEALKVVLSSPLRKVVVTGGEPLLQADALATLLERVGAAKEFHLETNGTIWRQDLLERFDFVTISPKLPNMAINGFNHQALESFHRWNGNYQVKVLVRDEEDWLVLEELLERYPHWGQEIPLVIQPLSFEEMLERYLSLTQKLAEEFMKWARKQKLSKARFIPQLHKVTWWGERSR